MKNNQSYIEKRIENEVSFQKKRYLKFVYKSRNYVNKIIINLNGYATLWQFLVGLNDEKKGCA